MFMHMSRLSDLQHLSGIRATKFDTASQRKCNRALHGHSDIVPATLESQWSAYLGVVKIERG